MTTELLEPIETPEELHPGELAHQLESLPVSDRHQLWDSLDNEIRGEVLPYLHESAKLGLLELMSSAEISSAAENMEPGDIVDVIELVSDELGKEIIDSLGRADRSQVERSLKYEDDVAGRLLDYDGLTVTSQRSVGQLMLYIRSNELPIYTDHIYVVGRKRKYIGAVSLSTVLCADDSTIVADLPMLQNLDQLSPELPLDELAAKFRQKHSVALPVVDADGVLLGRVTLDDAIDVLQDEADHQLMGMAGMDEEDDLFGPTIDSAKRRAVWLGINLLTALLASWVIGLFEATLQQVVALAVLMPIVASMGGIAGSQTLTLVIRGLALKQINSANQRALLFKELGVAVLNGALWALCVSAISWLWFDDATLGLVIGSAILINVIAAVFAGMTIPLILEKLEIDAALSGSVILTTVSDVIGFLSFLGLGSWLLL